MCVGRLATRNGGAVTNNRHSELHSSPIFSAQMVGAISIVRSMLLLLIPSGIAVVGWDGGEPVPTLWPDQFHALLYMNLSTGHLQISDLWYDWPAGRNVNLMQKQLGPLLHDVEWNNGTAFYYTLDGDGKSKGSCYTIQFNVGIPKHDWMVGSTYLGMEYTDGFLCHVWTKVEFIWYYEDVVSRRPVRWDFYDGISTHVMTFEIGAVLDDSLWQAPSYCFGNEENGQHKQGRSIDRLKGADRDGLKDLNNRRLK